MKARKQWWACQTFEGTAFCLSAENPEHSEGWYGPFRTWTEAKRDALAYHRATLETARTAIRKIQQARSKEFRQ